MSDFGDAKIVLGRKKYTCDWCGEEIAPGLKHAHFKGKWEGDWQNWRMHSECYEYYLSTNDGFGFCQYENERPNITDIK